MNNPVETELSLRLHKTFRKWAGNMGCGDHLPETWNAIAEIAEDYMRLRSVAKVRIGTSVLTRDLVWCDCERGLSLTGNWMFCPSCGRQIDQKSYRMACDEALRNGAKLYRNVEEVEAGKADECEMKEQAAKQESDLLWALKTARLRMFQYGESRAEIEEMDAIIARAEGRE